MNDSNRFGTIDYDACLNTKVDYRINLVFKPMTIQELNALHHICELRTAQLVTILAMSVQNPEIAVKLRTGNALTFAM